MGHPDAQEYHRENEEIAATQERLNLSSVIALVRPVTSTDFDGVLELLRLRHEEFGLGRYDENSASQTLLAAIEHREPIFAGVICGEAGTPEATIGLAIARFWDEADEHLQSLWDFVHPLHRENTEHAQRLGRFARLAAETVGCPLVAGGPIRSGGEAKVRVYCKHMRLAGAFFAYDGPDMPRGTKKQREE